MKLHAILASSTSESVKDLFDSFTIQKAIPYLRSGAVQSIKYDDKKDIISATVKGTKKYKISLYLEDDGDIEVDCNCPAAQEWNPHCKHGAAFHTILVEFFAGWDLVSVPFIQDYYFSMLSKVFETHNLATEQISKELNLTDGQKLAITKPTIIFVRLPHRIYPRIIFIDPDNTLKEIAKLLSKSVDDFDSVIETILSYKDQLNYYIHSKDGLIFIENRDLTVFHPEWHIAKEGEQIYISFFGKENDIVHKNCALLGNFYAIDFDARIIVRLNITNKKSYVPMSRVLLGLTYKCNRIQQDAWSRYTQVGLVKNRQNFLPLLTTETQLDALKQILLMPEEVNESLSFWDYNKKNTTEHLVINGPIIDDSAAAISKRAVVKDLIDIDFLSVEIEFRVNNSFIAPTNIFHVQDLIKLLNICFRAQDKHATFGVLANLIKCHRENMPIAANMGKQVLPAKEFKEFASLVAKFWQKASSQEIFKLLYDIESEQFKKVILPEKDIILAWSTLIEYCIEKNIKFAISQDLTIELASSELNIADLAVFLAMRGIQLYKKNKKIVHKKFDVEIDVSNQDNDWFSIHPSFYDKEILLTEAEWTKLLEATGNLYETEHEIHAFDAKTSSLLDSLRSIKKDYATETKKSHKRASFEVPRLHVFTLLSLYRSGARLRLSSEDKKIVDGLNNFTGIPQLPLPEKLQCTLRDYQVKGYEWLGFLYHHKFGACLADEMGLGKTVQTITFLAGLEEGKISNLIFKEKRPHLIIAPASVICNWEQEIQKFYPSFSTSLYIGPGRKIDWDMIDIVLTTYDTARIDCEKLIKVPFHVIIFDEAQAIKNQQSKRAHSVFQLQALFKVCLTGTPLENNAKELCSIINLALPGLLPNDSAISQLIKKGEYQALIEKISPFILRRTKKQYLADLPEKTENNVYLEMTNKQKAVYGAITDEIRQQVYQAYRQKTNAQAGIVALTALLRLRQICISPALIDKTTEKFAPKISYLLEEIKKQQALKIAMLVFSQFTGALDILEHYLKANKIKFLRIDGSVPTLQRKKIVEEFQNSNTYFVLILSLKTGGVGLNLTKAQVVYHLDPWWNPAVEDQASDRVHRIGQKNEVKIIRVLMKNSIEEKMLILKQKKKELFDLIMQGSSGARGTAITKQDFDFLLN